MKKLINYLLQGILYIAPLGITVYIIIALFNFIDGLLQRFIVDAFDINIPGLGLLTLLVALIVIGFIGKKLIAQPIKNFVEDLINRVPLLKFIYSSVNDVIKALMGKDKKFNQPVLVKVNLNSDLEKLGFITEEDLSSLKLQDKVAVYFPHSYNFSGELFIVPKTQIIPVDINSSDVMKFVVSAGVTGWKRAK